MKKLWIPSLCVVLSVSFAWAAMDRDPAKDMARSADRFLRSLSSDQKAMTTIELEDEERYNFHYIPRDRRGIPYRIMTPAQRKLAHAFLASGLSHQGMSKALEIMYLDQVLFEISKRPIRDPDAYYITVFGSPGLDSEWGWRMEGHHISLNFTLRDGEVVSSFPSFWGANPANVPEGPQKGMRVLEDEELMGRALLHSLGQADGVVLAEEAPADIITANERRVTLGEPTGLSAAQMSPDQKAAMMTVIELYAHRLRPELAAIELDKIESAGLDKIHFAWMGGKDPGQPHYYRIHGPSFLIEYDNTQNNANHIHTVWRDPAGDFGEKDPLVSHYRNSDHHHPHPHPHPHAQ